MKKLLSEAYFHYDNEVSILGAKDPFVMTGHKLVLMPIYTWSTRAFNVFLIMFQRQAHYRRRDWLKDGRTDGQTNLIVS